MSALRPLDIACGVVLGGPRRPAPLPAVPRGCDPLAALEASMLPALRRSPCLVSFSGGRDSSAVLAVATRLARREGLPDPVPATNRVPAARAAEETSWQEAVVAHLGLDDWLRLSYTDELDAVGPLAQRVLRRHGLLWPFNVHFHLPLLEAARGGSLLTGIGGDELFGASSAWHGGGRSVRALARAAMPCPVLRRILARRRDLPLPWLTPAARRAAAAVYGEHDAGEARRQRVRMAWARDQRYMDVGAAALERLAADAGTAIAHPLLDRLVWAAVCAAGGVRGFADRTEGMRSVFGELLPAAVLDRRDKATFDEVFWGPHARRLAAAWQGEGAPAGLVDTARLREHWAAPGPRAQSFTLLQAAWCSGAGGLQEARDGAGQGLPAARAPQPQYRQ